MMNCLTMNCQLHHLECPLQEGIMTVPYNGSLFTFSDARPEASDDPPGSCKELYNWITTSLIGLVVLFFRFLTSYSHIIVFQKRLKAPASDCFRILLGLFVCCSPALPCCWLSKVLEGPLCVVTRSSFTAPLSS